MHSWPRLSQPVHPVFGRPRPVAEGQRLSSPKLGNELACCRVGGWEFPQVAHLSTSAVRWLLHYAISTNPFPMKASL